MPRRNAVFFNKTQYLNKSVIAYCYCYYSYNIIIIIITVGKKVLHSFRQKKLFDQKKMYPELNGGGWGGREEED